MSISSKFKIIVPSQDIVCEPGCLNRFAGGDPKAFEWLYKNYSQKVYNYALLMTEDRQLSEDLVHEVFIKLWINREKLSSVENFNGYMYRLYRNVVLDTLKRQQKNLSLRKQYLCVVDTKVTTAYELLIAKEQDQHFEKAVHQLSSQRQLVFRLCRENEMKRDKIASTLKISPHTLKGHLHKAINQLRILLDVSKN